MLLLSSETDIYLWVLIDLSLSKFCVLFIDPPPSVIIVDSLWVLNDKSSIGFFPIDLLIKVFLGYDEFALVLDRLVIVIDSSSYFIYFVQHEKNYISFCIGLVYQTIVIYLNYINSI